MEWYSFIVKLFIYGMSGAIAGRFCALSDIDAFSVRGVCCWLISYVFALIIIEYPLYLKRRNKK